MIGHLDHLVIITENEKRCIQFYTEVLGMQLETFIEANSMPPVLRKALKFGNQKLNIKVKGQKYNPLYHRDMTGALDLCFIVTKPLDEVIEHLNNHYIKIEIGPVIRIGFKGAIRSVFIRDPDGNIIELSEYVE
uniref:Glyoxalase domain-containing protein 5 n=1 Tax=Acrobeloides nanus TaxID=290746 RepID=A0A914E4Z6_9BILA